MNLFAKTAWEFARDQNGKLTMDQLERYEGYGYVVDIITPQCGGRKNIAVRIDDSKVESPLRANIFVMNGQVSIERKIAKDKADTIEIKRERQIALAAAKELVNILNGGVRQ